jgi:hypothetical protein
MPGDAMLTDDPPTLVLGLPYDPEVTTDRTTELVTLLFGLSLGTALPPAAMLPPPGAVRPAVRFDPNAIFDQSELAATLGRPAVEVWHGRVALAEMDERLGGLVVMLSVFQIADGSGALVCLSAVRSDPVAPPTGAATPADLWDLARRALSRYEVSHERLAGLGDHAFLAIYGGVTAQVAWLAGDRVATASVTCLARELGWAVDAARSIAPVLDRRLTP